QGQDPRRQPRPGAQGLRRGGCSRGHLSRSKGAVMKRSTDRILTTHTGSLARPKDLLDLMSARLHGEPYDAAAYGPRVRSAVAEVVGQQIECGIDVVTDGEQSKPGFSVYVRERLTGLELDPS